jgi:hypothetical protein
MMRAIQSLAPNLLSARLLGTSNKKYAMKKNPRRAAESRCAEPEIFAHSGIGKADVHAIEIVDQKANNQDREKTPSNSVHGSLFQPMRSRCAGDRHRSRKPVRRRHGARASRLFSSTHSRWPPVG